VRAPDLGARLTSGLALLLDLCQSPGEQRTRWAMMRRSSRVCLARPRNRYRLLALEVRPTAHQAAADVLELRELDFQLAFEAAARCAKMSRISRCGRAPGAR